jgi:hypothetical protein
MMGLVPSIFWRVGMTGDGICSDVTEGIDAFESLFRPLATGSRKRSRGVEVGEEKTKLFIFLSFLHMGPSYFCYCRSTSTQEPPIVI